MLTNPSTLGLFEPGIEEIERIADDPRFVQILVPARAPADVAERLRAELRRAAESRELLEQLARQGIDVQTLARGEYARFLKAEIDKWWPIIKSAGIGAQAQ